MAGPECQFHFESATGSLTQIDPTILTRNFDNHIKSQTGHGVLQKTDGKPGVVVEMIGELCKRRETRVRLAVGHDEMLGVDDLPPNEDGFRRKRRQIRYKVQRVGNVAHDRGCGHHIELSWKRFASPGL